MNTLLTDLTDVEQIELDARTENDLLQAEKDLLYKDRDEALRVGNTVVARLCTQRIDAIIHEQHELLGPRD